MFEPSGRIMLHNASRSLGAQNPFVYRVIFISLNVPDFVIANVDIYPTTARTHVTCGFTNFIGHGWGYVNMGL